MQRKLRGLSSALVSSAVMASTLLASPAHAADGPAPSTSTSAPAAAAAASAPADAVWFVGISEESFATQVQRSIEADRSSADRWVETLKGIQSALLAGESVSLPGNASTPGQQLQQVQSALTSSRQAETEQPQPRTTQPESSTNATTAAAVTYELRGFAKNSAASWEVRSQIDGGFCSILGCQTTDSVKQTWTITPGRTGTRYTFSSIRTGTNLTGIYALATILCNGNQCGSNLIGEQSAQDGTGTGSEIVAHTTAAGKTNVARLQLRAYFNPNKTVYYDRVKTGTARCGSGTNYACRYV